MTMCVMKIIIMLIGSHNCAKPVDGEVWLHAMLNIASDPDDFYPDVFREVAEDSLALIGLKEKQISVDNCRFIYCYLVELLCNEVCM